LNVCVIANPLAGSADSLEQLHREVERSANWSLHESPGPSEAGRMARELVAAGAEIVVAAGGDGTLHEVINGIREAGRRVPVGIIPLGTGNDLVRTLGIPTAPDEAVAVIKMGNRRQIDLIDVSSENRNTVAANAAAGGFSGEVDQALTPELKRTWGPLAYLLGAASVLPDVDDFHVTLIFDDDPPEVRSVINIIVANGRTVAGGRPVAPRADPADGLMDVVIVESGRLGELANVAARLLAGDYLGHPLVSYRQARRLRIEPATPMWFNVDGELFTSAACSFRILEGAQTVLVPPPRD
jgi:diacylglycerol kinase (ATP)